MALEVASYIFDRSSSVGQASMNPHPSKADHFVAHHGNANRTQLAFRKMGRMLDATMGRSSNVSKHRPRVLRAHLRMLLTRNLFYSHIAQIKQGQTKSFNCIFLTHATHGFHVPLRMDMTRMLIARLLLHKIISRRPYPHTNLHTSFHSQISKSIMATVEKATTVALHLFRLRKQHFSQAVKVQQHLNLSYLDFKACRSSETSRALYPHLHHRHTLLKATRITPTGPLLRR